MSAILIKASEPLAQELVQPEQEPQEVSLEQALLLLEAA